MKPDVIKDTEQLIADTRIRNEQPLSEWLRDRRDAERYRFLRRKCRATEDWTINALGNCFELLTQFDKAVDEAMEDKE